MVFMYIMIGFMLIIMAIIIIQGYRQDVSYVMSNVDKRKYMVYNLKYKQMAADTLANVRMKLTNLCSILSKKYPEDERISRMISKFNPDNIVESEPSSTNTSYSINKGEKMVLCLRSRDGQNRIVKENVIVFVALHELAHIMTLSVGHTNEFWENFEFLLKEAIKVGYYKNIDFNADPHDYCGIKITDSPLK